MKKLNNTYRLLRTLVVMFVLAHLFLQKPN